MTDNSPILLWFRRDLRLADHAALDAASKSGRPVIPIFLCDEVVKGQGAAPRFRLGLSVTAHGQALEGLGSQLILRKGSALDCLRELVRETGATAVWWSRLYDPIAKKRDVAVKAALKGDGVDAQSFAGHLLFEPWTVETKTGGFYKVFTPMWKTVRQYELPSAYPAPHQLRGPENWPVSDDIASWHLARDMRRGAAILAEHCCVGEQKAQARLNDFIAQRVAQYKDKRNFPAVDGTSGLSENLTYGEISPRQCWHAGWQALHQGDAQAEVFLKELVWREFAYHLVHHTPQITTENWKPDWDAFPWNTDPERAEVRAWTQGRTGIPFVDAAMRQMYVTGVMHNRARMIVASYLTKHLMTHWRIGAAWFADCLTDWDPASNAMGWQWVAGSGPDSAPYFRVFNPVVQQGKFDPKDRYIRRWIAEGYPNPTATAISYFNAVPKAWGLSPDAPYPEPIVNTDEGRKRALAAYETRSF